MKKLSVFLIVVLCFSLLTIPVLAVDSNTTSVSKRLSGSDRYQTAKAIAEEYNSGPVNSIVFVPGNSFANALPASVLAFQMKAPMLLIDSTANQTKEAFDYLIKHLSKTGTIYLVGDMALICSDFGTKLNQMGYSNIVNISGADEYNTDYLINQQLNVTKGTPVIISSGENYPDALAISTFAANHQWPILLVHQDTLPDKVNDFLMNTQPSKIYITGGAGAVSSNVQDQIQSLLPNTQITRLGGQDRFETASIIAQTFAATPHNIFLATGYGFADALAGSVLAAKTGDPIILVDPSLTTMPSTVSSYIKHLHGLGISVTAFGGSAVVPDTVENSINNALNWTNQGISIVAPTINGEASNFTNKVTDNLLVRTGVNMDLLYIATETGGNFQNPQGYLLNQDAFGINSAVQGYFGKYVSNENAKELFNQAMQVPNPPHKFVGSEFTDVVQSDEGTLMQPSDPATWNTLSKFESDTKATDFFAQNRARYEQMIQDFVKMDLNFNHVQQLQDFFGKDLSQDQFEIVLSTIENGGQATSLNNTDGTETHIIIINPSDNAGILNVLYHETAHNFYDVRTEDPDLVNQYAQYADALGHHEADFGTELNETIARVVTLVMIDKYHGKEAAVENLNLVTQTGWKNTKEIATLVLNKYMNNRSQYKTFKDFMPVIFEYLKMSSLQQPFDIGPSQF